MRQNLINIPAVDIKDVDHLYIVGSTTKEGLIEGRSNVKIDLKKAVTGEGGSSSEAQEVFDTLFGQTPYFAVNDGSTSTVMTFEQLLSLSNDEAESFEEQEIYALYKEKLPLPRVFSSYIESDEFGSDRFTFSVMGKDACVIMAPVSGEDIPGGPWYVPMECEEGTIDLTSFPYPTFGNPTVLTGVEIPENENSITIAYILPEEGFQTETLNSTGTGGYSATRMFLDKVDGVWVWEIRIG